MLLSPSIERLRLTGFDVAASVEEVGDKSFGGLGAIRAFLNSFLHNGPQS
jgi:hypothetical protein